MATKPILFNTEMVRAILDGRKTVTRRVVKSINPRACCQVENDYSHEFIRDDFVDGIFTGFVCRKCGYGVSPPHGRTSVGTSFIKPPFQPSDILWVRETFQKVRTGQGPWRWEYKADCEDEHFFSDGFKATWRPSIHMPREAARIFLRVTDVQVEHLWDVTQEQALKEGFQAAPYNADDVSGAPFDMTARDVLIGCWDSTVKPKDRGLYGWAANPWVWVIEFERIDREEAETWTTQKLSGATAHGTR